MAHANGHWAAQQELERPVPETTSGLSPPKTKELASPKNVARKRGPKTWPENLPWPENFVARKRGPKTAPKTSKAWPENVARKLYVAKQSLKFSGHVFGPRF